LYNTILVTAIPATAIPATAIPSVTNHFKTIADIGRYASAYRLTPSSLQFMFGKFYSLFLVKVAFLVGLAIFEIGSLIAASAPTSKVLIVGRAISGVGSAGVIQGIFTMATQTVPLRRRSMYGDLGAGIESVASGSFHRQPVLEMVLLDQPPSGCRYFGGCRFPFREPHQSTRNFHYP
jgi:MFS family permease